MNSDVFQVLVLIVTGLGAVAMFFMAYTFNRGTRDKEKTDDVLSQIFKTLGDLKIEIVKISSSNKMVERAIEHLEKRIDVEHDLITKNSQRIESLTKFKHKVENDRENILGIIESFEEKLKEKK